MANNTLIASDSFASGALAAGWSAVSGQVTSIVTGSPYVAEPSSTIAPGWQIWTGTTWPKDQISELTISALSALSGTWIAPLIRFQSASQSGYAAQLQNGTLTIYRYDSGTPTSLATASVTVSAADVWSFMAAGSQIIVYQNQFEVLWAYDTTYTSGAPGFAQASTTVITDSKVGSWRGYSSVQQDGIWSKQGIWFPGISSDYGSSPAGTQNPTIIYEGNAQVIGTEGNVYKMWFQGGTNYCYAESLDFFNWTRYNTTGIVISGLKWTPCVFKVGSTYHAYGGTSTGATQVAHYTSSDGINWTLQSSNIFSATSLVFFCPFTIISGTWYALYATQAGTYPNYTYLATSPDGLTWTTQNGGSPVATNFWGLSAPVQVGTTWYAWASVTNPNATSGTAGVEPGETLRMQTTDFIHWTNPVRSAHHTQMYEGVNENLGGFWGYSVTNVNSKAYLLGTTAVTENSSPYTHQIGYAVAPASIAAIVQYNEDAVQQIAADAFTSGTGNLDSNWVTPTGGTKLQIVAGPYVEPTTTGALNEMVYTGAIFGASQYSEAVLKTLNSTCFFSLLVRASTTALTFYQGTLTGPTGSGGAVSINKRVAGTSTALGSATIKPQVGDVWRLSVVNGSDGFPILTFYQNGNVVLQIQDYSDAIASGYPGIALNASSSTANAQISSWDGGNANVIPTYPSASSFLSPFGAGPTGTLGEAASPSASSNRTSVFGTGRTEIIG